MSSHQFHTQTHAESSNAAEVSAQTREPLWITELRAQLRYQAIKDIEVKAINGIDWKRLEIQDPDNRLARLLSNDNPWRRFFDILEPSYDELVYEFWSTFYITKLNEQPEPTISFRLCGHNIRMSLTEFALHLGVYTEEEVTLPIYTRALTQIPNDIHNYWNKHSRVGFGPLNYTNMFKDPLHQFMHLVIASTIRGRASNLRRVSSLELFYLYCIFESIPCNIAHTLANYFAHIKHRRLPKNLMGGSYITKLAKSLGILNDQIIQELSPPKLPGYISLSDIKQPNYLQRPLIPNNPVKPANFTPLSLQRLMQQFSQSSFYRYDMQQPQQPPVPEFPSTDPPQAHNTPPQTPNYHALSPLPFGIDEMQHLFSDENVTIQDLVMTDFPLSPLLQQQSFPQSFYPPEQQHSSDRLEQQPLKPPEEQQPFNHPEQQLFSQLEQQRLDNEDRTTTVPLVNPPLDSLRIELNRLIEQVRRMFIQIDWLTQENKWQEGILRQIASAISMQITPSPPPPININSESDSDSDLE